MPDNPRIPDHPSDIPSSRATGRINDLPASSSGSGPASSVPSTPVSSTNKIQTKNIIIGAIVTIITSTTVFYLTQYISRKQDGNQFSRIKEATTAAWRSYIGYENVYAKNTLSYQQTAQVEGRDAYLKGVKLESEKFQKDILDLQKRKFIDEDLLKTFRKRIDNEKNTMGMIENYFERIREIETGNLSLKEKKDTLTFEMIRWTNLYKGSFERAVNELKEITKILADRYGGTFSVDEFLVVQMAPQMMKSNDSLLNVLQNIVIDSSGNILRDKNYITGIDPENLAGKWSTEGATITLTKNRKMTWLVSNGSKAEGTWKIENDQLKIQATTYPEKRKANWTFNLTALSDNTFSIVLDSPPYNSYSLIRIIEN